jgi:hypothetical protein
MLDLFFRLLALGDISNRGKDIIGFAIDIFLSYALKLRIERRTVFSLKRDFTDPVALFLTNIPDVFRKNLPVRRSSSF